MSSIASIFRALQYADSGFPTGAASFSWGLESLLQEGLIGNAHQLEAMVEDQLRSGWATADRSALAAAWSAADSLEKVKFYDWDVESQILASEIRIGSRRVGSVMLSVYSQLGMPEAKAYRELVRQGEALGHLPVVQGMLWRSAGLPLVTAELMSASGFCRNFASVAVRLGLINHIDAQTVVTRMEPVIVEVLRDKALPITQMRSFRPFAEIASMRHEQSSIRLFSN